jgi:O-antigen/teichoic acid export membrane protein
MVQSLIPAFSQMLTSDTRKDFDILFSRFVRVNLAWIFPAVMMLFVVARPFFTIWAGPEFGAESSLPFYILLLGLIFNMPAYVPYTAIAATGRTDLLAKLYWVELAVYAFAAYVLISYLGIIGAAAAWSLRVIIDAFAMVWLSKRFAGISFSFVRHLGSLAVGIALLLPPIMFSALYDNYSPFLIGLVPLSVGLYSIVIWKSFLEADERTWIKARASSLLGNIGWI